MKAFYKIDNGELLFSETNIDGYIEFEIGKEPTELKTILETKRKQFVEDEKEKQLEKHIYSYYSSVKQQQDEKWVSSYTTKLKAVNFENLELTVVQMATSFYDGETLEDILADIPADQKMMVEKLVKVAVRTEWMENCIKEGKAAIAENREPNYPKFPFL